jgi:hypothetical protein
MIFHRHNLNNKSFLVFTARRGEFGDDENWDDMKDNERLKADNERSHKLSF